ncbi:MAG: dihydrodipicolinate synthase family protein [Eubacteriales bacterium]|nr:dihydrodipicolinate synthase family protein [Eubacteriales bacterium]
MKELRGAIGVTVTPFGKDWQVDLDTVRRQAERLSETKITGVFPCASTGEFPHLSPMEQRAVYQATREGIANRKTLIAGACAPNLRRSIECAEMARDLGYDACVACPPYYYPLMQEEIYTFYRELAKASALPIIMYHVPFFTSGIDADTVRKLMRIPEIIGIKDSSANLKRIAHLCRLHDERPDFLVYTGTDDCLFPALAAGVDGNMTAFAAGAPELVTDVYEAFAAGDLAGAAKRQRRMMPLLAAADALPFPLGYKLVAQAYHALPMTQRYHQLSPETAVDAAALKIEALLAETGVKA